MTGEYQLQRNFRHEIYYRQHKDECSNQEIANNADAANIFRANIENREAPKYEKIIDGYFEFLFVDKNGNPVVAMNWHHRLNHMGEAIQ